MKVRPRRQSDAQAVVLLLVALAVVGGLAWWLFSARLQGDRDARAFGKEAATRLAFNLDQKFLNSHLGSDAQIKFPPSFRERFFDRLRRLGTPSGEVEVEGEVMFTSHFFQPVGQFRAHINYPGAPAIISLVVARPRGWWEIDYLNLTYTPPAPPSAPASVSPTPAAKR